MAIKFLWLGFTIITVTPMFGLNRMLQLVGAILMTMGAILLIVDK